MKIWDWIVVLSISFCSFASGSFSIDDFRRPFPIVEPDPGHTKLHISREGLEAIERIENPIAAVADLLPNTQGTEHGRGKVLETVVEIQDRHDTDKEIAKSLLELH